MDLSKLELQQMLREMGVKFSHTDSHDNLKQLLKQENHNRWLRAGGADGVPDKRSRKTVIRKKRSLTNKIGHPSGGDAVVREGSSQAPPRDPVAADHSRAVAPKPKPKAQKERRRPLAVAKLRRDKAAPVNFDRHKYGFETVLKRAANRCELCGAGSPSQGNESPRMLRPFHIDPLDRGGSDRIKNVVALCPSCVERVTTDRQAGDIKLLKRKARGRIIPEVTVITR